MFLKPDDLQQLRWQLLGSLAAAPLPGRTPYEAADVWVALAGDETAAAVQAGHTVFDSVIPHSIQVRASEACLLGPATEDAKKSFQEPHI